ncbi:MAG: endonuclease/exonuclease/phosphatase family protein [Myxococcota bacterium]
MVAWNLERGWHLDTWARVPALRDSDLLLLTELDVGMARSGNRHVARDLAQKLGLQWAFAPQFRELTLGLPGERRRVRGQVNREALHGLAILSRLPILSAQALALPDAYDWSQAYEARQGGRIGLISELATPGGGRLWAVCTHLECYADPQQRALQMRVLLAALDPGPCILGGDLNTTTGNLRSKRSLLGLAARRALTPWRLANPIPLEPVFAVTESAGFSHQGANLRGVGTGIPHWLPAWPRRLRPRVDWILLRGLEPEAGSATVDPTPRVDTRRLSEHDGVGVAVRLP